MPIPVATALKMVGQAAGAAVELYNVIQEQKRRRPTSPHARLEVERMDAAALEHLRELWR